MYESEEAVALIAMRSVCLSDLLLYYFYKSTRKGKKEKFWQRWDAPRHAKERGGLRVTNLVTGTVCFPWQPSMTLFTPQPVY